MGNTIGGKCRLTLDELNYCLNHSVFTDNEIKALWFHYQTICNSNETNQNFITIKQFQSAMIFKDSALLDRIFRVFDHDDDQKINFNEYISCLSAISTKSKKEDKLKFSFEIYDFDGDGYISISDLTAVLAATLREHGLVFTRGDVDYLVSQTMVQADPSKPNMISLNEYMKLVETQPHMMDHLTVNISSIIAEYTANNTIALATPR